MFSRLKAGLAKAFQTGEAARAIGAYPEPTLTPNHPTDSQGVGADDDRPNRDPVPDDPSASPPAGEGGDPERGPPSDEPSGNPAAKADDDRPSRDPVPDSPSAGQTAGAGEDDPARNLSPDELTTRQILEAGRDYDIRGHFYSPLPALSLIEDHYDAKCLPAVDPKVIDLRRDHQKKLLKTFSQYYDELPFSDHAEPPLRYGYINDMFNHGDAIMFYSFIREFRPRRIIEVGSGHSSAVMLDTNDIFFDSKMNLTFIEPYPERLNSMMTEQDHQNCTVIEVPVQEVDIGTFQQLQENDILFIDSSHVMKFGSDVGYLLFSVIPSLNPGVLIQFHDIPYPFEYQKAWLLEGRAWNEAYLLRAFLSYNQAFEVEYFNHYMAIYELDLIRKYLPASLHDTGGSLWLRKK